MNKTLTNEQAFLAMYSFLEKYYESTQSDDVGALLGSLSLLNDGNPADPAIQEEWIIAVNKVLEGKVHAELKLSK